MEKKIFINSLSLVLFCILALVFIWPKISETLETRGKRQAFMEKIDVLDKKTEKIESLGQELEKNIENQKIISEYLPATREDDFLINYLDNVAYTEGVPFNNIEIEKKTPDIMSMTQSEQENIQTSTDILPVAIAPKPVFETVTFNFFTSYEKTLNLLRKFDNLKRFNRISYLEILKIYPTDNKGDASLNFLQVKLKLDFNHLKKINSQTEIGENLFSTESFDQEALVKIKNKAINGANNPDGETGGRNNPFIP